MKILTYILTVFVLTSLSASLLLAPAPAHAFVNVDWNGVCCDDRSCVGESCGPEEGSGFPVGVCTVEGLSGDPTISTTCVPPADYNTSSTDTDTDTSSSSDSNIQPRRLDNPLGTDNLGEVIARIISIFTGVSGSIALLMFVYGGFLWLTSAGDSGKVETGRKAMVWAVIGLIIIFGAYAILNFIFVSIGARNTLL